MSNVRFEDELLATNLNYLSIDEIGKVNLDFWHEESNIVRQQIALKRKMRKYRTVLKNYRKLQNSILAFNKKYVNEQS